MHRKIPNRGKTRGFTRRRAKMKKERGQTRPPSRPRWTVAAPSNRAARCRGYTPAQCGRGDNSIKEMENPAAPQGQPGAVQGNRIYWLSSESRYCESHPARRRLALMPPLAQVSCLSRLRASLRNTLRLVCPCPLRNRLSSSRKAMSNTQWSEFSICQWERIAGRRRLASGGRLVM